MRIVCATTEAATQTLMILLFAQMQPDQDFQIRPVLATTPPLTFTLLVGLPAAQMAKIRAVPDTMVSD